MYKDSKQRGQKFDNEKIAYELVPVGSIEGLAKILTYGAVKYTPNNWRNVRPINRYYGALLRHVEAVRKGEWLDQESGMPHLHHALCNVVFLSELLDGKTKEELIKEFNYER